MDGVVALGVLVFNDGARRLQHAAGVPAKVASPILQQLPRLGSANHPKCPIAAACPDPVGVAARIIAGLALLSVEIPALGP
jgi:hypothetical protein